MGLESKCEGLLAISSHKMRILEHQAVNQHDFNDANTPTIQFFMISNFCEFSVGWV